jgi:small subunit ribosomal protein S20
MKRVRSDRKKRERNQTVLSELHTLDQKMRKLAGEAEKAEEVGRLLISRFDRAVSQGIVPRGRASRKKSRTEAFLKKIKSAARKA